MGFFATIIWVFFCVLILCIYGLLLLSRVSKGIHIWGKPIPQEKYQSTKINYGIFLILLIFLTVAVPFKTQKPKAVATPAVQPQVVANVDWGNFANTEANQKIMQDAYNHFAERVQGKSKIESIDIIFRHYEPSLYLYRQEDYGWYNEMEIVIKIAADDKTVYEGLPMMNNNLFYYFGGGRQPGMVMSKVHSAYFYGFKKDMIIPTEDNFVDDKFYKIIDELTLE